MADESLDYEDLSNGELVGRIEKSNIADKFQRSEDWKLVREACNRAKERASEALIRVDPDKKTTVIELQMLVKIFGNFIPSLIRVTKEDGDLAHEELQERGLSGILNKILK